MIKRCLINWNCTSLHSTTDCVGASLLSLLMILTACLYSTYGPLTWGRGMSSQYLCPERSQQRKCSDPCQPNGQQRSSDLQSSAPAQNIYHLTDFVLGNLSSVRSTRCTYYVLITIRFKLPIWSSLRSILYLFMISASHQCQEYQQVLIEKTLNNLQIPENTLEFLQNPGIHLHPNQYPWIQLQYPFYIYICSIVN